MRREMTNENKEKLEELFENTTEDVSEYLWAVHEWQDMSGEYSPQCVLLSIFASRARAKKALEKIEKIEDVGEEYKDEFYKLKFIFSKCEDRFNSILKTDEDRIKKVLSEKILVEFDKIKTSLKEVVDLVDNVDLTGIDWIRDELREAGFSFAISFQEMAYLVSQVQELWPEDEAVKATISRFNSIEEEFKQNFASFKYLKDVLNSLKEREYSPDFWWLKEDPEKTTDLWEELDEKEILPAWVWKAFKAPSEKFICDYDSEKVIGYALGELVAAERTQVQEHIYSCDYCFNLMLDTRLAEVMMREKTEEVEVPQELLDLIKASAREKLKGKVREFAAKARDFLDILPSLLPPVPVPAPAPVRMGRPGPKAKKKSRYFECVISSKELPVVLPEDVEKFSSMKDLKSFVSSLKDKTYYYFALGRSDGEIEVISEIASNRGLPLKINVESVPDEIFLFLSTSQESLLKAMDAFVDKPEDLKNLKDVVAIKLEIKS